MSVGDWNKIGQNQRVRIMTVDPVSRKVEAATKDGAMIQIAVWGQPTIFRWPIVGETWIVTRMGGFWILVEPVQKNSEETAPLEAFNPGDVNVTTGEGGQFLVNGQTIGGGLEVFGTPTNGQVPEWVTADNRAEWTTPVTGGGGFTPTFAQFTCGGGDPFLKHVSSTNAFYAPWSLNQKSAGSAYAIQNNNLGDVTVPYIIPDGTGVYLIRWNGYTTVTNPPAVGDVTLVRFVLQPIGFADFISDAHLELGNPSFEVATMGLLIIQDPTQRIAIFLNDEANTGKPDTVACSGTHWLDITKVCSA